MIVTDPTPFCYRCFDNFETIAELEEHASHCYYNLQAEVLKLHAG